MLKVDILCPNTYGDWGCDSYESRVYMEQDINTFEEIFPWICEQALPYLNSLDREYHGCRFEIYIDHEYRGEINTIDNTFELLFKFRVEY